MRLLVAEDDPRLLKTLTHIFESNKFSVDGVSNGEDALAHGQTVEYDGMVLDIMMPGMDGVSVLKALRKAGVTTPALFLTARSEVSQRVEGLDAGADDYLPKPFAASEFLARVRALARRSQVYTAEIISLGNTSLDCSQYTLSAPGRSARLNNKEYQLMELFFRHPHQVFSTKHLMDKVWGLDSEAEIDVVWTYIGFLRRKLKELRSDVEIRTIRGAGYALEEGAP